MRAAFLIAAAAFAAAPASAGRVYTDAEILGVVSAAGQGGLDAAEIASERARADAVKSFAERARKELEDEREDEAEAAAEAGLTPADSATSLRLTKSAFDERTRLSGLGRDEFDAAYVDAQASDAEELVRALDEELIPSARDRSVAELLKRVRASASRRLERARRLQGVKSPS